MMYITYNINCNEVYSRQNIRLEMPQWMLGRASMERYTYIDFLTSRKQQKYYNEISHTRSRALNIKVVSQWSF